MKRQMISLAAVAALTGCASGGFGTMDRIMASWQGASVDQVIAQWGYPHEERRVAGRTLLVWNRDMQLSMPATATTTGTANRIGSTAYVNTTTTYSGGGTSSWSCTRILEIRDDKVHSWQWEGNNCPFAEAGPYSNWRRK